MQRDPRPDATDLAFFRAQLRALAPLTDEELAPVIETLRARTLPVGAAFLAAGDEATHAGLIREGLLREYYLLPDGSERTRAFGVPGDFAGSLSDLLRGGKARTHVVAERPARVLTVPWALLLPRLERGGWRTLIAGITRRLYLAKSEREYELLGLDAEERYRIFRERFPGLERRVAQRHVASYLGITPEHLSRVRARLGLTITAGSGTTDPPQRRRESTTSAPAKPPTKKSSRTSESIGDHDGGAAHIRAPRSGRGSAIDKAKPRSSASRRGSPRPRSRRPT